MLQHFPGRPPSSQHRSDDPCPVYLCCGGGAGAELRERTAPGGLATPFNQSRRPASDAPDATDRLKNLRGRLANEEGADVSGLPRRHRGRDSLRRTASGRGAGLGEGRRQGQGWNFTGGLVGERCWIVGTCLKESPRL